MNNIIKGNMLNVTNMLTELHFYLTLKLHCLFTKMFCYVAATSTAMGNSCTLYKWLPYTMTPRHS